MPRFFAYERAAHAGEKQGLRNVDFKKNDFENSLGAQAGSLIEIIPVHIKNPPVIQFIAYLDSLSDNFNPEYSTEQPFGRTDPYYIWKSSRRSISVGLSIPSSSVSKGLDNLNNLNWLLASTYPSYKRRELANTISATPLFRVRYANLIASRTQDGQGILCVIDKIGVTHDLKAGFILAEGDIASSVLKESGFDSTTSELDKIQIPKLVKLNMTLNVVHDHTLGWDHETGQWRGGEFAGKYPYGFGLKRDIEDTPGANVAAAGGGAIGPATGLDMTPDNRQSQVAQRRATHANADGATDVDLAAAHGGDETVEPD